MTKDPHIHPDPNAPLRKARSRGWFVATILAMVILWLLVVSYRQEIRVRWWAYRLRHADNPAARMHYVQLLAAAGPTALPRAEDLLHEGDAGLRSFAVALLNTLPGAKATDLLIAACDDADATVRKNAIMGLSMRKSPTVLSTLQTLTDHPDLHTAMFAVNRLSSIDSPQALEALGRLARSHPRVGVRAEAIHALAAWRGDQVVDALIACLGDEAVYHGLTVSQRQAMETLGRVAPHMLADDPRQQVTEAGESNGARAARALRRITGQSFGYLESGSPQGKAPEEVPGEEQEQRQEEELGKVQRGP